jgi:hypothetical protein
MGLVVKGIAGFLQNVNSAQVRGYVAFIQS